MYVVSIHIGLLMRYEWTICTLYALLSSKQSAVRHACDDCIVRT